MGLLLLGLSVVGALLVLNVHHPVRGPAPLAFLSFFVGWLTGELFLHHVAFQAAVTLGLVAAGALASPAGWLGLGITLASWAVGVRAYLRGGSAAEVMEGALRDGLGDHYLERIPDELRESMTVPPERDHAAAWRRVLRPFKVRHPDVERIRDLPFARGSGRTLRLDIYLHRSRPENRPALLYIHGGGWVIGDKNQQGLPLVNHLAARGWVCLNANYRLSPHATFPEHLIDVKRAIAWFREHATEFGAHPGFLAVAGGSAGAHLASLTAGEAALQPGFEDADTSVQGCVSYYGVYDFTDRFGIWPHAGLRELMERHVMKAEMEEEPERFDRASPMSRIHPDAPPFFVIHGDLDTLVPIAEARYFAELLGRTSRSPVALAEIPGAQHGFEIFHSLRSQLVTRGALRFLTAIYGRALQGRAAGRAVAS